VLGIIMPALRVSLVTWVLCGIAYPLAVTGLGQWLLPVEANGSLVRAADGTILGSRLIGQDWTGRQWFHGRPSATASAPYNAAASGGSNLGPTNRSLATRLATDRRAIEAADPEFAGRRLPADMLTASASGLDPDISPADAALQVPRVAAARGIAAQRIATLVARHTAGRDLGIFGERRVNVLELNLDLQNGDFPGRPGRIARGRRAP
jgi:potassium-transporting ATPase KdpC subunit